MKLVVDHASCAGHGRCYAVSPTLLTPDDDGFVSIRGTSIDVPTGSEAAAREAAAWCPEAAINIDD